MKKIILAFVAAVMVASAGFAGSRSGMDVGVAFSNISIVDKNDSKYHMDFSGWGATVGYYEEIFPLFGIQASLFATFPDTCKVTSGSTSVDLSSAISSPILFSAEALAMLNIPVAIFDFRVGSGIAYTFYG